jgi:excisionase family DNA binding protein
VKIKESAATANQATTMHQQPEFTKAFYTLKELCERWGVCRMTVYRELRRGRLKKKLIGGTVRFSAEEIYRYERQAGG